MTDDDRGSALPTGRPVAGTSVDDAVASTGADDPSGDAVTGPIPLATALPPAPTVQDLTPGTSPAARPSVPGPSTAGPPQVTPDGIPKLLRLPSAGIAGGVCAGIAAHLRVPVVWVRVVFALLALMGGAGAIAYILLWIFVPAGPADGARELSGAERRQAYGIAAVGVALMIAGTAFGFGDWVGYVLGPLGLAAIGGAFIWRESGSTRRARWKRSAAGFVRPTSGSLWRLLGGVALVIGGLSVFALGQTDFTAVRSALVAVLLTLVGVAIITVPWWIRLVRDLGDERRERIRERERAEIAAHLHDSVLQTLALIQRQSGDSREVLRLARGQERELRSWLYGPAGYASPSGAAAAAADPGTTFATALAAAAGEVEDTYAIAVAPVVVGDVPMDQHLAALVAAAREAMVNAAKHAGVDEISVYAEVENSVAAVFVRDRGKGFDPEAIDSDRRGLAQSVRGRMDRHGGTAVVRSRHGEGTEVELTMPITVSDQGQAAAGPAGPAASPVGADGVGTGR